MDHQQLFCHFQFLYPIDIIFAFIGKALVLDVSAHLLSSFLLSDFKTWQETVIFMCRSKSLKMGKGLQIQKGTSAAWQAFMVSSQQPSPGKSSHVQSIVVGGKVSLLLIEINMAIILRRVRFIHSLTENHGLKMLGMLGKKIDISGWKRGR